MYRKAIDKGIVTQEEMNEYKFQIWLERQPFDEIVSSIHKLSASIKATLSTRI